MRAAALMLAATMLLPLAARAAADQAVLKEARAGIETADYSLKGRLVRVDGNGKRTSYGISLEAHWFPQVLRVLLDVNSPAEARVHVLLDMHPEGRSTILIAHPGDAKASALPFDKWIQGPLGDTFSFEDFLDNSYFWEGQKDLGEQKFGMRQCDQLISTPGPTDETHYSQVSSLLDRESGLPVYVEKTMKGSGKVKEFTSFGLRRTQGVWSATQIEGKIRGQAGSTLLIIDRGSAKAHLGLKNFSLAQLTNF